MPSALFVGAVVLGLVAAAVFLMFSSDTITKKAPQIVSDFLSGISNAIAIATQSCGGYKDKDSCKSDSLCEWCKIDDENQNTLLFCTTQKKARELNCPPS